MNTKNSLLKRYSLFIGVFVVIVILAVFFASNSDSREEIHIGVITPLTGGTASWGNEVRDLLNHQLDEVNKKENSPDYKFRLEFADGACDGPTAEAAYESLRDDNDQDFSFILGGLCSAETLAIAPHLVGDNILAISALSSHTSITDASDNLFSLSYSNMSIAEGIAQELANYGRIVMVTEDNEFNTGLKDDVNSILVSQYGAQGRIAGDIKFPKGSTDFADIIEGLREINPDIIFLNPNIGDSAIQLAVQLEKAGGFSDVALVSHSSYLSSEIIATAPEFLEGMTIVDAPAIDSTELDSIIEEVKDSTDSTLDNIGRYYTAAAVDSLELLTKQINAEGPDVAKVRDSIKRTTYNGLIGNIQFTDDSNFPSDIGIGVYKIMNGEAQPYNPAS